MIIIPIGMLLFMFVTDENTQMNQYMKWLFEFAVPWCVCVHNKQNYEQKIKLMATHFLCKCKQKFVPGCWSDQNRGEGTILYPCMLMPLNSHTHKLKHKWDLCAHVSLGPDESYKLSFYQHLGNSMLDNWSILENFALQEWKWVYTWLTEYERNCSFQDRVFFIANQRHLNSTQQLG